MTVKEIRTIEKASGEFRIPGSKSYTNRALICAALAEGESTLENVISCDDTNYMKRALSELGIIIEDEQGKTVVKGRNPRHLGASDKAIYVGSAGTTMRFLTGFCCLVQGEHDLEGTERMHERPLSDLAAALGQITDGEIRLKGRCPPVRIVTKGLKGGEVDIRVDTSSQYLSSLLLISPYAKDEVIIRPVGKFVEKPYIDMTLETMMEFGVTVDEKDNKYFVTPQTYEPKHYFIESDASGATYFMAAAAITGGKVIVGEFRKYSKQGDLGFVHILEQMGCSVRRIGSYIEVRGGELKGIDVNMKDMPDAVQTLAVLAAVADGKTIIRGCGIRLKETDRIKALEQELAKTGIKTESTYDSITIHGGNPIGAEIETYDDHRTAMSFSVLGLKVPGIRIRNPECVSKSLPNFYELFEKLESS